MLTLVARLSAAALAAAGVGAATGVLARALMRLLSHTLGMEPSFSWAATVAIVVVFMVFMGPAALGGALTLGRTGWFAAARWTGIGISAALLLVMATARAVEDGGDAMSSMAPGRLVLTVVLLAGIAVAVVGGAVAASRLAARWSQRFAATGAPNGVVVVA